MKVKCSANIKLSLACALLLFTAACSPGQDVFRTQTPNLVENTSNPKPVIPDLLGTQSVRIQDDWVGLAPEAPIAARFYLHRDGTQFTGTAEFEAGGFSGDPLKATEEIAIPLEVMESFLLRLTDAPVEEGTYIIPPTHTDDYPQLSMNLTSGDWSVEFYSDSQNSDHTPWRFESSHPNGVCRHNCVIQSDVPTQALDLLNPYLKRDVQEKLFENVRQRFNSTDP